MSTPAWLPTDVDGLDDQTMLGLVRRQIAAVLTFGQQNQLRGNLQQRASLKELRQQEKELLARISAARGRQYNLAGRKTNRYGHIEPSGCAPDSRCCE